ncbi:MAG: leucine-rich repeat domain-containing protein [Sphingobacteriales bacterium JAD_PAG50586_3]|nr:MAG: leucine-rich repeat domain-containing protein [Sphingobacteriales bacterium JAD_PAG50586_3]
MKVLRAILLVCVVFAASLQAQAQLFTPYDSPAEYDEYRSLDEALKEPDKVQRLVLRRKGFKEFPKEIYKFKNLVELDLRGNNITDIPDSISTLIKLQYLNVSRNAVVKVSPEIGKLKDLIYLELGQNAIEVLPMEMAGLNSLQYLSLWENELTRLPYTFEKLDNLKEIDLRSIVLNTTQRDQIKETLPEKTVIFLSPDCNCKQ